MDGRYREKCLQERARRKGKTRSGPTRKGMVVQTGKLRSIYVLIGTKGRGEPLGSGPRGGTNILKEGAVQTRLRKNWETIATGVRKYSRLSTKPTIGGKGAEELHKERKKLKIQKPEVLGTLGKRNSPRPDQLRFVWGTTPSPGRDIGRHSRKRGRRDQSDIEGT